jgi:DNA polymerase III subunit gamma/tau
MEKFIVSALKYRPQNFSTVIGQKHITTTLKNAIANNTLAHAFLFCGPRGVGKTTCARILAKTINCENLQPDGEACNICGSCISFNSGKSLNIHELDAASNNSVDDIRDLVTQIRFIPQEGKYKIYIIDEVHMLTQQAFNAFLKTLEEPPSYAKFILATTEKHKILPTILSRCQIFDFKRITNADTVEHLQEITEIEKVHAEKSALQLIAQKSEGCMRDALSLLDKIVSFTGGEVNYVNTIEHLNLLDEDQYFKLLEAIVSQDIAQALLLFDAIHSRGFEGDTILNGFASVLRNLLISKDGRAAQLLDVLEGMQQRYADAAARLSLSYLVSALQVVAESEMSIKSARNKRLHVELALIKLCYLQQVIDFAVNAEGKVVKKKRLDGPIAVKEKPVSPLLLKSTSLPQAALIIQSPVENYAAPAEKKAEVSQAVPPPVHEGFVVQEPGYQPASTPKRPTAPLPPSSVDASEKKVSLLEKMKAEKLKQAGQAREEKPVLPPDLEDIREIWSRYTASLKEAERHTMVTSFQIAELRVEGNEVVVLNASRINQRIVESEASELLSQFKQHFNNPDIKLRLEVMENDEDRHKEIEPRYLNAQERFKLMAGEYPAVLELKEKLKLDLKY